MVEGAPLLREYTRNGIVGSNPIFSAIYLLIDEVRWMAAGIKPAITFTKTRLLLAHRAGQRPLKAAPGDMADRCRRLEMKIQTHS